ncbi:MAG: hypothetical protein WCP36_04860 [Methanomicrobiales archaeon]
MAETKSKDKTRDDLKEEVQKMVENREFLDEKNEFSLMVGKYAERSRKTEGEGWNLVTHSIVEVLPDHLSAGIITCSLEKIEQEKPCRDAVEKNQDDLTITAGDNFPAISFPTFYPYLDFVLRAGPVDISHMKKTFRVEGTIKPIEAVIRFKEKKVRNVSGTILVSANIYLCKGDSAVKLHQFEKKIKVE